jgi:GNAT superfamily N-acetyltransferase
MHIRRAIETEHRTLSAIAVQAKAHWRYSAAQLEAWRDDLAVSPDAIEQWPTYVVEVEGQIAGFYMLMMNGETWWLEHLWVMTAQMGRGLGRALVAHAAGVAAQQGAATIAIDADPNAESCYLACGATRVGAIAAPIEGSPSRQRPQLVLATKLPPPQNVNPD